MEFTNFYKLYCNILFSTNHIFSLHFVYYKYLFFVSELKVKTAQNSKILYTEANTNVMAAFFVKYVYRTSSLFQFGTFLFLFFSVIAIHIVRFLRIIFFDQFHNLFRIISLQSSQQHHLIFVQLTVPYLFLFNFVQVTQCLQVLSLSSFPFLHFSSFYSCLLYVLLSNK